LRTGFDKFDFSDSEMMSKLPVEWIPLDFDCLRPTSECYKTEFNYMNNLLFIATAIFGGISAVFCLFFLESVRDKPRKSGKVDDKKKKN